jgi:drug/metabolite transporter (DMT)-like permease
MYVICGSSFTLLVKGTMPDGRMPYEPVLITLIIEFTKLMLTLLLLLRRDVGAVGRLWNRATEAIYFAVPACCYCIYNALQFYNLQLVQPGTYRLMITAKVLYSGLLLNWFFPSCRLKNRQWVGLFLLFVACAVEQVGSFQFDTGALALILLTLQALCSSFAGVYFQFLLQRDAPEKEKLSLWEKNFYLYTWGCVFNGCYLFTCRYDTLASLSVVQFTPELCATILISSLGGFATSLILQHLDVIVKEYANFIEMLLVVFGSHMMFAAPVQPTLLISVAVCSLSLFLYNVPEVEKEKPRASP